VYITEEGLSLLTVEEQECLRGCSSYAQYHLMRSRFESGVCGFCHIDRKVNHVVFENAYWAAWENIFSHDRACAVMLVIASRDHWRRLADITKEAWGDLEEVMRFAERTYEMPGGMLFLRFGDMRYNVGTVPHLHFNLWVPDRTGSVVVPIQKSHEMNEEHGRRAQEFARRYASGEAPD
jgi:diadenosine tetraphosphate (Ap4A) HIT family hydrolase